MNDTTNPSKSLLDNFELIADCARFAEGLYCEADVKKRHRLPADVWEALGSDDLFVEKVEEEKLRRIKNGSLKRERAQRHVTKAPDILAAIMEDPKQSARHRIDSAKALDGMSDTGPDAVPQPDQFTISIILSADERLTFSKYPTKHDAKTIANKTIEHDRVDTDTDNADDDTPRWLPIKKDDRDQGGGIPWE
jgi:hypothetical protein